MKTIAQRLLEIRTEKGFNKSEMARQLGIASQQYGQYERGDFEPKITFIEKVKDVFGVDLTENENNLSNSEVHSMAIDYRDATIEAQRETIELQKMQIAALREEIERLLIKEPLRPGKAPGVSTKKNVEDA